MEYPFKDLLPLDEVLEREGYYRDWTHLDPEVFYSLTQISNFIKTKGYGVDVRLLIAQLAEHFGLKTTQVVDLGNLLTAKHATLKTQFEQAVSQVNADRSALENQFNQSVAQMEADKNTIVANATVDSEVILARGGKPTLGARFDDVTAQLAQTDAEKLNRNENESISMAMLAPDIKQAINDGEWTFDVNTSDIENQAVTLPKLNNPYGILPKGIPFTVEPNPTRAKSPILFLNKGDEVRALDDASMAVYYEKDGVLDGMVNSSWYKTFVAPESRTYIVRAIFDDELTLQNRIEQLSAKFYILTDEVGVKLKDFNTLASETIQSVGGSMTFIQEGVIVSDGTSNGINDSTRVSVIHLPLKNGEGIRLVDADYQISLWLEGTPYWQDGWNTTSYTADRDITISFTVRKKDLSTISPSEGNKAVQYRSKSTIARLSDIPSVSGSDIIKHVSTTGSDTNTGNTIGTAYATLQKALDEGATKVYMERGIYRQTVKHIGEKLTISPYNQQTYSSLETTKPNQSIFFQGAKEITGWTAFEGVYRLAHSGGRNFTEYFIDKTLPEKTTGTRPQYNVLLWETKDKEIDYLMRPVLSLEDCKTEQGSFFWDGVYLFVNPLDIENSFYQPDIEIGLDFSGTNNLNLLEVESLFYMSAPMNLDNIKELKAVSCVSAYASYTDGFSLDYTNGILSNCHAYKNRNDGFNMHFFGHTVLENCHGFNNYDDGVSHHEFCTGVVNGGVWRGNAKGGVAPVNYAQVDVYNALIEGNGFGLYSIGIDDSVTNKSIGNIYKNNDVAIMNSGTRLVSSDKFVGNGVKFTGQTPIEEY